MFNFIKQFLKPKLLPPTDGDFLLHKKHYIDLPYEDIVDYINLLDMLVLTNDISRKIFGIKKLYGNTLRTLYVVDGIIDYNEGRRRIIALYNIRVELKYKTNDCAKTTNIVNNHIKILDNILTPFYSNDSV